MAVLRTEFLIPKLSQKLIFILKVIFNVFANVLKGELSLFAPSNYALAAIFRHCFKPNNKFESIALSSEYYSAYISSERNAKLFTEKCPTCRSCY